MKKKYHPEQVRFFRAHDRDVVTITDGENTVQVYGAQLHDFVETELKVSAKMSEGEPVIEGVPV